MVSSVEEENGKADTNGGDLPDEDAPAQNRSEELKEFKERLEKVAHNLADAHALLAPHQHNTELGQLVFNSKVLTYQLLNDLQARELDVIFKRRESLFS